ncbi:MAG: OsmC family protein [Bacteroidota bacterium]
MKLTLQRRNQAFHFEAINEGGQSIQLDANPSIGGENKGMRPMETIIAGLGGCSAIDIGLILKKQKIEPEKLWIDIEAEREAGKTPALFTDIYLHYHFEGNIPSEKAERAIRLSIDKYCSVAKILAPTANIHTQFTIHPVKEHV